MGEKQKGVKMLQVCKNTIMNEYRNKMKYNVIKLLVSASLQFRNRPKLVKPAAINRNRWTFEVNRNCNQSWTWSGPSVGWVGLGWVGSVWVTKFSVFGGSGWFGSCVKNS